MNRRKAESEPTLHWSTLLLCSAVLIVLGSTCSFTSRPRPTPEAPPPTFRFTERPIDWSRDGRLVLLARFFRPTDPAHGLYLVPTAGGPSRFVTPIDLSGPRQARLCPNNTLIAATYIMEVRFINARSGEVYAPFHTDNGSLMPDWSPDGMSIVYVRGTPRADQPADSGGIHIYNRRSHTDRPLRPGYPGIYGLYPRWFDSSSIVFLEPTSTGYQLDLVDNTGDNLRVLRRAIPPPASEFQTCLLAGRHVVVLPDPHGSLVIDAHGTAQESRSIQSYELISPDGDKFLTVRRSPTDTTWVVYIESPTPNGPVFHKLTTD